MRKDVTMMSTASSGGGKRRAGAQTSANDGKLLFYDVSGRADGIYMQHFKCDGFRQDWLHFHAKYELSLILSGDVDIISGGKVVSVAKPHIILHKPFVFHSMSAKPGMTFECFVFYFSEESLKKAKMKFDLNSMFREGLSMCELKGTQLVCAKTLSGMTLLDLDDGMRRLVLSGMLTLAESGIGVSSNQKAHGYISEILDYINENASKRITAEELAKKYYISEQKLNLDFKRLTGDTLHHYHTTVRITKAASLISRGMTPLAASVECGFVDETHFSKTFKSRIGITPYQFAKQTTSRIEYSGDYDEKNTTSDEFRGGEAKF